jgi:hypothetical protein
MFIEILGDYTEKQDAIRDHVKDSAGSDFVEFLATKGRRISTFLMGQRRNRDDDYFFSGVIVRADNLINGYIRQGRRADN